MKSSASFSPFGVNRYSCAHALSSLCFLNYFIFDVPFLSLSPRTLGACQDVERAAEDGCPLLRGGCCAAFSLPPPSRRKGPAAQGRGASIAAKDEAPEALFLVAEVTDAAAAASSAGDLAAAAAAVRAAVSAATGAALDGVFLLAPRSVPKTTSGKIARAWCKRALAEGSLDAVHAWFDYSRLHGHPSGQPPTSAAALPEASAPAANERDEGSVEGSESGEGSGGSAGEMSEAEVLAVVVEAVAVTVLRVDPASINPLAPVPSLGLGSMEGVQARPP